jgi:hypothetical protein
MITKGRHHINKLYNHYDIIGGSSSQVHHVGDSSQCSSIIIADSDNSDHSLHFMNKFHKY